jgi:hypothetical protein
MKGSVRKMTKETEFNRLSSIMRQQYALTGSSKFTIKADDNVAQIVDKLSKYIWKNSSKPTNAEIKEDLLNEVIAFERKVDMDNVVLEEVPTEELPDLETYKKRFRGFDKVMKSNDDLHVFKATIPHTSEKMGTRTRYMIVSDSATFRNGHCDSWAIPKPNADGSMNYGLTDSSITNVQTFSTSRLTTIPKIRKSMLEGLQEERKLCKEDWLTDEQFTKAFDSYFRGAKQRYLTKGMKFYTSVNNSSELENLKSVFTKIETDEDIQKFFRDVVEPQKTLNFPDGSYLSFEARGMGEDLWDRDLSVKSSGLTRWGTVNGLKDRIADEYVINYTDQFVKQQYADELNVQLMEKYDRAIELQTRAKAWQTKKNIPEKMQQAMEESLFHDTFNFVEYDETVDIDKVKELEKQWLPLSDVLPKPETAVNLRFRFLGNYKANGIWVGGANTICVDPRSQEGMASFIHEYGHFLDYRTSEEGNMSMQPEFRSIMNQYHANLDSHVKDFVANGKYDLDYFKTPTEVFARSWETYINTFPNVQSNLCKSTLSGIEYDSFDENVKEEITAYFDNLYPELRPKLEQFVPYSMEKEISKEPVVDLFDNLEIAAECKPEKQWYALTQRPVSVGTQPSKHDETIDSNFAITPSRPYGAVGYSERLSSDEVEQFDLSYLGEGTSPENAIIKCKSIRDERGYQEEEFEFDGNPYLMAYNNDEKYLSVYAIVNGEEHNNGADCEFADEPLVDVDGKKYERLLFQAENVSKEIPYPSTENIVTALANHHTFENADLKVGKQLDFLPVEQLDLQVNGANKWKEFYVKSMDLGEETTLEKMKFKDLSVEEVANGKGQVRNAETQAAYRNVQEYVEETVGNDPLATRVINTLDNLDEQPREVDMVSVINASELVEDLQGYKISNNDIDEFRYVVTSGHCDKMYLLHDENDFANYSAIAIKDNKTPIALNDEMLDKHDMMKTITQFRKQAPNEIDIRHTDNDVLIDVAKGSIKGVAFGLNGLDRIVPVGENVMNSDNTPFEHYFVGLSNADGMKL